MCSALAPSTSQKGLTLIHLYRFAGDFRRTYVQCNLSGRRAFKPWWRRRLGLAWTDPGPGAQQFPPWLTAHSSHGVHDRSNSIATSGRERRRCAAIRTRPGAWCRVRSRRAGYCVR